MTDLAVIAVRLLSPADVVAYREIRLESLRRNPEAFGSTFESEEAESSAWFEGRLKGAHVFGAFRSDELAAIGGYVRQHGTKYEHKALMFGMYVSPNVRRLGIGTALVRRIIEHAAQTVEQIHLSVIVENEPARRLYRSQGFVEYGIETHALKQNGRYYDEILMAKQLTPEYGL